MNDRSKLTDLAGSALVAWLLSLSMTLVLADCLRLSLPPVQAVAYCAAGVCLLFVMTLNRWGFVSVAALLVGGAAAFFLRGNAARETVRVFFRDVLRALITGEGSLSDHAQALGILIAVFCTVISYMLVRVSGGVYPALLLYLFVLMGSWFMEERLVPGYVVPGLVALALLYARSYRESASFIRAISIALAAALLAVALLPRGIVTWKPLADAAEKAREIFSDYFLFTDPRAVYSVASDGYQPLGEALGGPASPREDEIMRVDTDRTMLLRGSIKRTYTGYSWVDNTVNSRFLMLDPTKQDRLHSIFCVDKTGSIRDALTEEKFSVAMLSHGTSTLFVPNRLNSFSISLSLATYFNDSGEVFMARSVEPGDSYSFSAYTLTRPLSELVELFDQAADGTDGDFQRVKSEYMSIPTTVQDDVYWITQNAVQGITSPLEKALALQAYLTHNYTYSTEMPFTPQGQDFVSYFLLQQGKGYCTYFASALAIMARMAGMPSRYVEGYLVQRKENGETVVTGADAHAWVEIYFEGVGWVEFDPTPGSPTNETDPAAGQSGRFNTPEPTPTPTPEPPEEPVDQPPEEPTEEPSEEPSEEPGDSPTPEPEGEPDSSPEPSEEPSDSPEHENPEQQHRHSLWFLWLLLVLAAAALALALRLRSTSPAWLAGRVKDPSLKLMIWYRACLSALWAAGAAPQGGEAPCDFAARLVREGKAPEAFAALARAVERCRYSGGKADSRALGQASLAYRTLLSGLRWRQKLSYCASRVRRGIGNYEQIP